MIFQTEQKVLFADHWFNPFTFYLSPVFLFGEAFCLPVPCRCQPARDVYAGANDNFISFMGMLVKKARRAGVKKWKCELSIQRTLKIANRCSNWNPYEREKSEIQSCNFPKERLFSFVSELRRLEAFQRVDKHNSSRKYSRIDVQIESNTDETFLKASERQFQWNWIRDSVGSR